MENQHHKISGYRELNEEEIALMNRIKAKGEELKELIDEANELTAKTSEEYGTADGEHYRWSAIAKSHLQQGLMALTRAVAKPNFF